LAAASASGPAWSQPAGTSQAADTGLRQAAGYYRFRIGEIEVTAVHDGFVRHPLEGLIRNVEFPQVQEAMREAFLSPDALDITFTALVIRNGGRLMVIDAGNGDFGPPTPGHFGASTSDQPGPYTGQWLTNFLAAGFDPNRVDTVLVSHFHADHINGLRRKNGSFLFPNAEVMVPSVEWAFWMDDGRMNQAPDPMKGTFRQARRVFGPIAATVRPYEAGQEVAPGVTAVAAPGHTPGHTAFMIASGSSKLLMMTDTSNHPALFVRHPEWSPVFDMDPDTARQTRVRLLDMAASERAQVSFYHAPFPATGHIAREGSGFRFVPVQWSLAI
jgi:glyoxylase-like metal-dependent hydrolase (beta-lactamase superfamily II)